MSTHRSTPAFGGGDFETHPVGTGAELARLRAGRASSYHAGSSDAMDAVLAIWSDALDGKPWPDEFQKPTRVRAMHARTLQTVKAAQQARVQVPPGLKERCAEILGWHRTGVLTGRALRDFAESKYPNELHALQMAEADTAREAYRALTSAPEAPAQAPEIPQSVLDAIRQAGFTLVKTAQGYQLMRFGEATAQSTQPTQGEAPSEREAFEAWYFDKYANQDGLRRRHAISSDDYEFHHARDAWEGWQAGRAALASQPQAEAVPVVQVEIVVPHLRSIVVKHILGAPMPKVGDHLYITPPTQASQPQAVDAEDAARYRYLRDDNATEFGEPWVITRYPPGDIRNSDGGTCPLHGKDLDAAIDAARRAGGAA